MKRFWVTFKQFIMG